MTVQPQGYAALHPDGRRPAVLVLHAWWGLNADVRAFSDALAEEGFSVFAPDFYQGRVLTTVPEAEAAAEALDASAALAGIAQAAHWLRQRSADTDLAVIGFSLGAFLAQALSCAEPGLLRSVVSYYAARPGDYSASRCDYLAHFAATDPFATEAEIDAWRADLEQAGRPLELHRYADTGHWFAEPSRPDAYQPVAAQLAWQRNLTFLRR